MHRKVINTVGKESNQLSSECYLELLPTPPPITRTHPMSVSLTVFIICKARNSVRVAQANETCLEAISFLLISALMLCWGTGKVQIFDEAVLGNVEKRCNK